MSVEAFTWALNLAPVPMDPGGRRKGPQPSAACAAVLVGLANHAAPDGTDAFPSVATLQRYTRLSERTVRACLDRLAAAGIIRPGDPAVVAAKIKRGDRRPQGWDLALDRMRTDLSADELDAISQANPCLRPWIEQHKAAGYGVQPLHLVQPDGVQPLQPRGATTAGRGAAVAPEPSLEPSLEPGGAPRVDSAPPAVVAAAPQDDEQPTSTGPLTRPQLATRAAAARHRADELDDAVPPLPPQRCPDHAAAATAAPCRRCATAREAYAIAAATRAAAVRRACDARAHAQLLADQLDAQRTAADPAAGVAALRAATSARRELVGAPS